MSGIGDKWNKRGKSGKREYPNGIRGTQRVRKEEGEGGWREKGEGAHAVDEAKDFATSCGVIN